MFECLILASKSCQSSCIIMYFVQNFYVNGSLVAEHWYGYVSRGMWQGVREGQWLKNEGRLLL